MDKLFSWIFGWGRCTSYKLTHPFFSSHSIRNGPITPFVSKPKVATIDTSGSFGGPYINWLPWLEIVLSHADDVFDLKRLFREPYEGTFFASTLALFTISSLERNTSNVAIQTRVLSAYPKRFRSSMNGMAAITSWHVKYKSRHVDQMAIQRLREAWKRRHGTNLKLSHARYLTLLVFYQIASFVRTCEDIVRSHSYLDVFSLIETIRLDPNHPAYFLVHIADRRARHTIRDKQAICVLMNASHGHLPDPSSAMSTTTVPTTVRGFVTCGLNSYNMPKDYLFRITQNRNRVINPISNYSRSMFGQQHFSEATKNYNLRLSNTEGPGQPHSVALHPRFFPLVDKLLESNKIKQKGFVYRKTRFQVFKPGTVVPNARFEASAPTQGVRSFVWNPQYPSFTSYDDGRRFRVNKSLWEGKRYSLRHVFAIAQTMCKKRPTYVVSHSCLHYRNVLSH